MKVVLPIMTRHEEAWKTPEGREITRQFLVMAEALDHDAVVATDDAVVADLAQTLDLPVLPVEEDAVSTAWPPGTQDAVKQVRASEDGPLLILDFRNPLLRSDHVVQAVASFRESGDPVLASVVKIRDLPCQFKLCLDLAQTVAINPLDPDFTPPSPYQSLNATRAIPMAWEGANVTKNNYYVREAGVFGSRYKPDDGQRDEPDTPVWLFENPGNGRIVFRREHDSTGYVWPQGFPVFDCRGPSLKDGRYTLKFIRRLNDSRRYYFKLSLIRETGAVSLKGMGELLGPDRRELTLRFDDLGAYCILVHIYEVVDRGIYELQEPFCPSEADWAFDSRLRGKNLVTGKSIQGRQEVSETYDLDSSIVILAPGADLPTRAETLLATGFRPFVLDSAESVHLHSRLDFVRYKAKKGWRSMGNETETRLCNALVEQANAVAERFGNDPDTPGLEADFERVTKSHEDLINRFGRDIDISGAALGWWQSAGEAATADANLRLVDTTVSFNGVRLMERYQLLHLRMLPFFEARIDWLRGNRRFEGLLHACEQVLRFDPGNDRAHAALCHIEREARQPEEVAP